MSGNITFGKQFETLEKISKGNRYSEALGLKDKAEKLGVQVNNYYVEEDFVGKLPEKEAFVKEREGVNGQFNGFKTANDKAQKLLLEFEAASGKIKTKDMNVVAELMGDLEILNLELRNKVDRVLSTALSQREQIVTWEKAIRDVLDLTSKAVPAAETMWDSFCTMVDAKALQEAVHKEFDAVKQELETELKEGPELKKEIDKAYNAREFATVKKEEEEQVKKAVDEEKSKFDQAIKKTETALERARKLLVEIPNTRKAIAEKFIEKTLVDRVNLLEPNEKKKVDQALNSCLLKWQADFSNWEKEINVLIGKVALVKKDAEASMVYFNQIAVNNGLPIPNSTRLATTLGWSSPKVKDSEKKPETVETEKK